MQKEKVKVTFQNFFFELLFKNEHYLEMTATDVLDGRKFENKNVEFLKLSKLSIIAALQENNVRELECKICEQLLQKLEQKEQNQQFLSKDKCLRLQFKVSMDYIQPFSETAILYQIQSQRKYLNVVPKKLSQTKTKQIKRKIKQIEEALPTGNQSPEEVFKVHEVGNWPLTKNTNQQQTVMIVFIGFNIFALVLWITYFSFLEFLTMVLVSVAILIVYLRNKRYLIKSIELGKGTYKVTVTGTTSVQNYSYNPNDSFILHAEFNRCKSKQLKIYINHTYCYTYPFTGSFIIDSDQHQSIDIRIRKNLKFNPLTLQNGLITVEKLSHFLSSD